MPPFFPPFWCLLLAADPSAQWTNVCCHCDCASLWMFPNKNAAVLLQCSQVAGHEGRLFLHATQCTLYQEYVANVSFKRVCLQHFTCKEVLSHSCCLSSLCVCMCSEAPTGPIQVVNYDAFYGATVAAPLNHWPGAAAPACRQPLDCTE